MQLVKLLAILFLASQSIEAAQLKILLQNRKSLQVDDFKEHSSRSKRSTCEERSCIQSSSCQCVDYQEKMDYTFPNYISTLASNPYVKVFQSLNVASRQ